MSATSEKARKYALELDPDERVELAYDLLRSVDEEPDEGWDAAWLAEVRRRFEELRTGRVQAVPLEEVERRAEELLAKRRGR